MGKSHYRCARCGKRLTAGKEIFLYRVAYGAKCYKMMLRQQIAFETMIRKKAKDG